MSNQVKKVNRQKRLKKAKNMRHNNRPASLKGPTQTPTMTQMLADKRRRKLVEQAPEANLVDTVKDKFSRVADSLKAVVNGFNKATR